VQFEFDKTSLVSSFILFPFICSFSYGHFYLKLEMWAKFRPMPNVMAALPNIDGARYSTPQSLADAHY